VKNAETYCALGHKAFENRKIVRALACYERALRLGASFERVAERLWMSRMMVGDFESAWRVSDEVLARRKMGRARCDHLPLHLRWVWNGSPLGGDSVLVRCYHGLGDTLQFLRYVPLLKRFCRTVMIEVDPSAVDLAGSVPGVDGVARLGDKMPETASEIESMELAYAFRTTVASIPAQVPYVSVSSEAVWKWQGIVSHANQFRIGLTWAAGAWNPTRSIPVLALAPLQELPNAMLFALQRGPEAAELMHPALNRIVELEQHAAGILDTAAAIMNLDLVITVDTMVAHLAGALGKPVWVLLPFHADWRWMLDRDDSPWYPTMRLFRQRRPGDWKRVVHDVIRALWQRVECRPVSNLALPDLHPNASRTAAGLNARRTPHSSSA
jgi:hypothetical protein